MINVTCNMSYLNKKIQTFIPAFPILNILILNSKKILWCTDGEIQLKKFINGLISVLAYCIVRHIIKYFQNYLTSRVHMIYKNKVLIYTTANTMSR